jgi:hypothetical protein
MKFGQAMLVRLKVAARAENHTKHINARCGYNVQFFNIKPDGAEYNRLPLKG